MPKEKKSFNWILRKEFIFYILIFTVAIFSNSGVSCGQFAGEDEATQMWSATRLIKFFLSVDWFNFSKTIAAQSHPPLRYILSIPGILLFPNSEFGLRLVAILISFYMTYQIIQLGRDIGGNSVGFMSGFLIACSPVYNLTSMAFCWSLTVVLLIHSMRLLMSNPLDIEQPLGKRTFVVVNILLIIAFLVNTGNLLFFISTILIFLLANAQNWSRLVRLTLPFVVFYILYYVFFLIIVPYLARNVTASPFGQLHQTLVRAGSSHLNLSSFVQNIQGINAYFFPYLSWIFFISALLYLLKRNKHILIWLSLFTFAWSFYLAGNTAQYFMLVFICLFPFGVKFAHDLLGSKRLLIVSLVIGITISIWNYNLFIREYGDSEIVNTDKILPWGYAQISRRHNIVIPYYEIGKDIDTLLSENSFFIHDLSGCFTMFYYKDDTHAHSHTKYKGALGSEKYPYEYNKTKNCYSLPENFCEEVQIIVTDKYICSPNIIKTITYPKTNIILYLLNKEKNGLSLKKI